MRILLIGASGRLGQKIAQKLRKKNVDYVSVERVHTETLSNFQSFLEQQRAQQKECVILDVSLAPVTETVANFLCEILDPAVKPRDDMPSQAIDVSSRGVDVSSRGLTAGSMVSGLIVGTTGHSEACQQSLKNLSAHLPVCLAPNFSKGIYFLGEILNAKFANNTFTQLAEKLGFTKTIHEVHHKHKKDAPSGTALWLGKRINVDSESITSERTGEVVGEHYIILQGENETIAISHTAHSRDVFAEGACDLTLRFIEKKLAPGLYSLSDIW